MNNPNRSLLVGLGASVATVASLSFAGCSSPAAEDGAPGESLALSSSSTSSAVTTAPIVGLAGKCLDD